MKKKIITCITIIALVAINNIAVFAAANQQISLPANQVWTAKYTEGRSRRYSYVLTCCDAVYPISGTDNFSRIQVRVLNGSGTVISEQSYTVIQEGAPTSKIPLKEGYLSALSIDFQFRGNSASAAKAVVDYDGL